MLNYIPNIPRTAMDVFNILPEGTLCEVIDNILYMSPTRTTGHQIVLGDIITEIYRYLKDQPIGEVCLGPCDVYLDHESNVVIPDIIFVNSLKAAIVRKKGIYGTPDFLIEILLDNIAHDKERKLKLYERNLIPEYIIIDPDTKETWHYLLVDFKYQLQTKMPNGELYISQLALSILF